MPISILVPCAAVLIGASVSEPHTGVFNCDLLWGAVCVKTSNSVDEIKFTVDVLSRKFWSAKNFGPGDQNSWKIGPPDHYFLKILVRAWNYGPSGNTLV